MKSRIHLDSGTLRLETENPSGINELVFPSDLIWKAEVVRASLATPLASGVKVEDVHALLATLWACASGALG